ncbi:MAG: hypothetical protein CMJ94_08030 [Planctomycetes bacterium]|nr:hypothetical protein [Planctomycetota bacterium]
MSAPAAAKIQHAFLLGRGRSGTTWIAQILNRFSGCVYKDEPFNPGKNRAYTAWQDALGEQAAEQARIDYDRLVRGCVHDVDYPPFLRKSCRPQPPAMLRASWQLGKAIPALRGIYHWYGRPKLRDGDWVLTKQVNFPNEKLPALCEALDPKLMAVLRGPFASVSSSLRFYHKTAAAEFRPAHALQRVAELTAELEGELPGMRAYSPAELEAMSEAAFEALRWRIQTEPLARFTAAHPQGLVVTHEGFAADPLGSAEQAFAFLGWPLEDAVREFIDASTAGTRHQAFASDEKKQHGVHRDPKEAVQRWRKDLDAQQIEEISAIIAPSELLGLWPDQAVSS